MLVRCTHLLGSSALRIPRWALARRCADVVLWDEARGHQSRSFVSVQCLHAANPQCRLQKTPRYGIAQLQFQLQSYKPVAQLIECYLFTHRCTFSTVTASATTQQRRKLLLYSKEGCHLCDGLKVPLGTYVMAASCKASKCDEPCCARPDVTCVLQEKIQALLDRAQFMPSPLTDVDFEVIQFCWPNPGDCAPLQI